MKKTLLIISLLGIGTSVSAITHAEVLEIYNSPEWERSFVGSYGIDPGVEPEINRQDTALMTLLGKVRDNIQAVAEAEEAEQPSQNFLRAIITDIDAYLSGQRGRQGAASANVLQIAGNISMRLSELAQSPAEIERWENRSIEYFEAAVESFPNFLRVHKNLGNILFRNEDRREEAKKHLLRALELGDNDSITYGLLGFIYFEEERYTSAEIAIRNSLMLNPESFEFRQVLAQVLFNQQRFHEAESALDELLVIRPNSADLWNLQANAYIATDRIDQAAYNLEMVRMMGVANAQSLRLLGDVYMNRSIVDAAADAYLEAIDATDDVAFYSSFAGAARTLINFSGYEEALAVIERLEGRFGDSLNDRQEIELLTLRSQANIAMGRGIEAIENLEAVLRRDPFNGGALIALGQYYSDLAPDASLAEEQQQIQGRRHENRAILYFERAQEVDDIDQQVRAYIAHARLRVRRQELDTALDLLESAQGLRRQEYLEPYVEQVRQAVRARRARS